MEIVFHHVNWLITLEIFISYFPQKYENKHLYHVYKESIIRIDGTKRDVPHYIAFYWKQLCSNNYAVKYSRYM